MIALADLEKGAQEILAKPDWDAHHWNFSASAVISINQELPLGYY